jgi:enamine deaminase RidA (YjgF/YER057c/UK114 family)
LKRQPIDHSDLAAVDLYLLKQLKKQLKKFFLLTSRRTLRREAQVRQTMLNVKGALEAVGASFENLVRLDTYVVASVMNDYKRVKHDMLAGVRVSGATVYVYALQPSEAMIEISGIAALG